MTSSGELQETLLGEDNVDFVLVWDAHSSSARSDEALRTRRVFESNLEQEGLVLSRYEHFETGLHFVKIHAPTEVLKRYAEILKLRLPMKKVSKKLDKYLACFICHRTKRKANLSHVFLDPVRIVLNSCP